MKRTRLICLTTALACGVLGPAGVASAEDPPSSSAPVSSSATPSPAAVADAPTNQAPVAVDDPAVGVVAGSAVLLRVLANDTDDGLGRPVDETPHLEVASFDALDGRVTLDATRTVLTFTSRATDADQHFTISYTATDGSLTSPPASAAVSVTAPPPPPPVRRTVSLTARGTFVALHTYALHGRVSTTTPGPVTVAVQHLMKGRWRTVKSDRTDTRGTYLVRFGSNRPERQAFRAVATWKNGVHATSSRLTRSVVARVEVHVSGPLTRQAVPYSYRSGCPVRPRGLRRITLNRFTYARTVARGTLVVRAEAVAPLLKVFRASFSSRFPIRTMKPSDVYYAHGRRTPTQSDVAAMRADNTSAFNCRPVTGNPYRVSQHSYGNAIDINTVRNPYVVGSRVYPGFARTYLDRGNVRTGMITRSGVIATRMRANGWPWGARWSHPDYQHFSANGG